MKIAICTASKPFTKSKSHEFVNELGLQLTVLGHTIEKILLPYTLNEESLYQQLIAMQWIELQDFCDLLVCVDAPMHLIPHANKLVCFTADDIAMNDLLFRAEQDFYYPIQTISQQALKKAYQIYVANEYLADRLELFFNIKARTLSLNIKSIRCDFNSDKQLHFTQHTSNIFASIEEESVGV
jgi:hypothetical protein